MIQVFDIKNGCANTIKIKFVINAGYLDETSSSLETLIFHKDESVVDQKFIGYYKVNYTASLTALL